MKPGVPASVYVVDDPRHGLRKVGMSMNVDGRLRQFRLRREHLRYTSAATLKALQVEQVAHRLLELAGKRVREELFSATIEECIAAIERAERIVRGLEPAPPPRPKKQPKSLALNTALLDRLEAWIASREMPVSKTAVFETALREFLDKRERKR